MKKTMLIISLLATATPAAYAGPIPQHCEKLFNIKNEDGAKRRAGIYRCNKLCLVIDYNDNATVVACDKIS